MKFPTYTGPTSGSFITGPAANPSEQPNRFEFAVALGAFANDGRTAIATVGSQISVLANNGSGAFTPALALSQGAIFNSVFTADVNRDGRPDLILGWLFEVHVFLDEPTQPPAPSQPAAPTVQGARESARTWREGRSLAHITRKKRFPIGTTFSFLLNETADVKFAFVRRLTGRRVGRKCVPRANRRRHPRICTRTAAAGQLSFTGHAGVNTVAFQGRLSRSRRLKPGRYMMTITATNAGNRSAPV